MTFARWRAQILRLLIKGEFNAKVHEETPPDRVLLLVRVKRWVNGQCTLLSSGVEGPPPLQYQCGLVLSRFRLSETMGNQEGEDDTGYDCNGICCR